MHHYKLSNIEEFPEDTLIRDVRMEKERQLKKEEEEKKMKRIQEKVYNLLNYKILLEYIKLSLYFDYNYLIYLFQSI